MPLFHRETEEEKAAAAQAEEERRAAEAEASAAREAAAAAERAKVESFQATLPRWEYMTAWERVGRQTGILGGDEMTADLNRLGAQGWELVGVYGERAIFKRQLPPPATGAGAS